MTEPEPKKRKKPTRTAHRSLAYVRGLGWRAEVVERYNSFGGKRKDAAGKGVGGFYVDLFGFIDILAYRPGEGFLAVQTTSGTGFSARVAKILGKPQEATVEAEVLGEKVRAAAIDWLAAGGHIQVHGWRKLAASGKWEPKVAVITREMLLAGWTAWRTLG